MAMSFYRFPMELDLDLGFPSRASMRRMRSETDDAYEYSFVLPGVEKDMMEVDLYRNKVTVTAKKIGQGQELNLEEAFTLPNNTDGSNMSASLKDGVLKVTVPKKQRKEPVAVTILDTTERLSGAYEVEFEVPGARLEDISVMVDDNDYITVKADGGEHKYFRTFQRSYVLPRDANPNELRASYQHGLLTVQIPKYEPKNIEISKSEPPSSEDLYTISLRVPGIPPEKIKLAHVSHEFYLTASYEKSGVTQAYEEAFRIPDATKSDEAKAFYHNGILTITAPRAKFEHKKVAINMTSDQKAIPAAEQKSIAGAEEQKKSHQSATATAQQQKVGA